MIKLAKLLFEGSGYITQLFGNKLVINGVDIYGQYGLKGHNGIDYGIPNGRKLYSCINGIVKEAQIDPANNYTGGYGNYVKVENNECGVVYAHMMSRSVKVGDVVKAGDVLGLSDNTGNSTGPHLHFGVHPIPRNRQNGYNGYINPFDGSIVQWVDEFEEVKPEEQVQTSKDKVYVEDSVSIEIKEPSEEIGTTDSLFKAIANFIKRLWEAIVRSILG